jgi:hypothetical protein
MAKTIGVLAAAALVTMLSAASSFATPVALLNSVDEQRPNAQAQLHLAQECWQRIGPFATQDTAWQRWREAQNLGYAVSNGVVPCYDQSGTRGYCFNVFYSC